MRYKTLYSKDSNYKLEISYDEDPVSPDEWSDEELFLVFDHRNFDIRREGFEPENIYEYLNENKTDTYENYFAVGISAYIHSGVTVSLRGESHCPWDTSTAGYILVSQELTNTYEQAEKHALGLLVDWNLYLGGDVYCYTLYKKNIRYSVPKETYNRLVFENKLFELQDYFTEETDWEFIDSIAGVVTKYPDDVDPEESKNEILYDFLLEHNLAGEFTND